MKLADLAQTDFRYLRLRQRLRPSPRLLVEPPVTPIGVKLELTYACNLRCAFCYTDSPRRTLQRSTDLSDDDWRRIVEQAIDAGIVEAVVTGGEPLLRKELTLELIERLAGEGIGVAFNTNGWFVDDEVAERLSPLQSVTVHMSLDGAAPHLHDGSRGVPGSWRRAVEGADRLLAAGVNLCIVHVLTPDNVGHFDRMLEQMWVLGISWMRPTPVVITGAAARGGDWTVERGYLKQVAEDFERRRGSDMRIDIRGGTGGDIAVQGDRPPGSMLIRPNGAARVDSLRPFSYGNAAKDGVSACWNAIRAGWSDERVAEWASGIHRSSEIGSGDLVAYLDDEVPITGEDRDDTDGRSAPVPALAPLPDIDPEADFEAAAEKIRGLAMGRAYRLGAVRSTGGESDRILRCSADGRYLRLNSSASAVMDALDDGTPGDAARALTERFGAPENAAREDTLTTVRSLLRTGVVAASGGSGFLPSDPGASDIPGMEPTAEEA